MWTVFGPAKGKFKEEQRTRSSHGNGLLGRRSQADSDVVISDRIVGRSYLRHYMRGENYLFKAMYRRDKINVP